MDCIILEYIKQRITGKGYKSFRIEPFVLNTDDDVPEYIIPAYNEFFFLVSKDLANGTVIHSDTNVFPVIPYFAYQNMAQLHEFTGLIIIENPPSAVQLIEFIRVLPE